MPELALQRLIFIDEGGEHEASAMAGDVNLFFNDADNPGVCEVEVMIAEERWRRKGLAREAVLMLMRYGKCPSAGAFPQNYQLESSCYTFLVVP